MAEIAENTTRRNPEMEKYVKIQAAPTNENPSNHVIMMRVQNQAFSLMECEDLLEAEWYRDMLCIALARIVAETTSAKAGDRT